MCISMQIPGHVSVCSGQGYRITICGFVSTCNDVLPVLRIILRLVYQNTYVASHGVICRLRTVTAMRWVFSPINAIIALLRCEYQSQHSWLGELLLPVLPALHPDAAACCLDKRYIDDLYSMILVDRRYVSRRELLLIIEVLRSDTGLRYAKDFQSRMMLKCEVKDSVNFLDMTLSIDPFSLSVSSVLFEKVGKVNSLLHAQSNSAFGHYQARATKGFSRVAFFVSSL